LEETYPSSNLYTMKTIAKVISTSEFNFDEEKPRTRITCAWTEEVPSKNGKFISEVVKVYAFRLIGHVATEFPKDTMVEIEPTEDYEIRPKKDMTTGILRADFIDIIEEEEPAKK